MNRTDVYVAAAILSLAVGVYAICKEIRAHTEAMKDVAAAIDCTGPLWRKMATECEDEATMRSIKASQ